MFSADILAAQDRCPRNGYYSFRWEFSRLHPTEILRRSVDAGLMSEEADPGQAAGDSVMTYAAERGLDIEGSGVYPIALHNAALADLVTTALRGSGAIWARPADRTMETLPWASSAFLDPSGTRLHRVLLVDRTSDERLKAEKMAWRSLGEMSVYELPMTIHVVVIGQRKGGKHHGAWSKGFLHPRSRTLRIRKKSGESFGKDWAVAWREEQDTFSRNKWLDAMEQDDVMADVLSEVHCDPPEPKLALEMRRLAERKLLRIRDETTTPDLSPGQCWWPTPCPFAEWACWKFQEPSVRAGFVQVSPASLP